MRGNHEGVPLGLDFQRSIPAHAGEPVIYRYPLDMIQVYPRTCGGTVIAVTGASDGLGLSPHMRGNPDQFDHIPSEWGSIPAHAGEPASGTWSCTAVWVYPRTCGGTVIAVTENASDGLEAVYPRTCGGTSDIQVADSTVL